LNNQYKQVK